MARLLLICHIARTGQRCAQPPQPLTGTGDFRMHIVTAEHRSTLSHTVDRHDLRRAA
ncbi:MAG: hypothetical protein GY848_17525 [Methyloversatilis sp.]|jgi:hypothetical protein|nr:hypothetical protein [Methyloversatilis sp.]